MEQQTGHVIIIMGPTGSGKGTLVRHVRSMFPQVHITVSCTTRAVREGEVDGREYHFVSPEVFTEKVARGEFLEWAQFGLNRYGTLKSEILPYLHQGSLVLAEIELQGVEQLRALLPQDQMTVVYVEAGSWETLRARAVARAPIADAEMVKRHERYLVEVEAKKIADIIIDNSGDDPAPALRAIEAFVTTKL